MLNLHNTGSEQRLEADEDVGSTELKTWHTVYRILRKNSCFCHVSVLVRSGVGDDVIFKQPLSVWQYKVHDPVCVRHISAGTGLLLQSTC